MKKKSGDEAQHIAKMVFGVFVAYAAGLELPKPCVSGCCASVIIAKNSILLLLELRRFLSHPLSLPLCVRTRFSLFFQHTFCLFHADVAV